jgi:hypothetical protein
LSKIALWRSKAIDNTLTIEEMREAVLLMREGRIAAQASAGKAKKAKGPTKSADDILGELDGI